VDVITNLGVEELDEFSPSPGIFTDLGYLLDTIVAALIQFLLG
jgi:hypothetical protein